MIKGIGVDVVDIARFEATLARVPRLRDRLFTRAEAELAMHSLAARFAAKEALAKALGSPGSMRWTDAEVVRLPSGEPRFSVSGTVAETCHAAGIADIHLSLSHDGGMAIAFVVVEGGPPTSLGGASSGSLGIDAELRAPRLGPSI